MVKQVSEKEELSSILSKSKLTIIVVYDSRDVTGRYISGIIEDLSRSLEPVFSILVVDAAISPLLARTLAKSYPRLLLYIDGRKVWEQIGFFYTGSNDRYAIRRGILMALRSKGIRLSALGVKLNF